MIALALVALAHLGPNQGDAIGVLDARIRVARMELAGPFDSLELRCGAARTLVHGPLTAGERRFVGVPFVGGEGVERLPATDPASELARFTARFIGWEDDDRAGRLAALPRGLGSRPPPAPERLRPRPRASALVALVGAGAVVLLLRRRVRAARLVACGALVLLATPPVVSSPENAPIRVLEGDGASGRFVWIESGFGSIEVDGRALLALSVRPGTAPADLVAELRLGAPERWTLRSPGRRITAVVDALGIDRMVRIDAGRNDLADLCSAWLRPEAGESFGARGAWSRGAPLPPPRDALDPPPGWLVAGLPPGRAVLVASLGGGGPRVTGGPALGPGWLRLVGFRTESH